MSDESKRLVRRTSQKVFFPGCEEFDFHLLAALSYTGSGAGEIGECFAAVQDVGDYDFEAWNEGWTRIARTVLAEAEADRAGGHLSSARAGFLRAWNYFGQAEFFLPAGSPEFLQAHDVTAGAFRAAAELPGPEFRRLAIPFEGKELPGWFFPAADDGDRRRTLIVITGNDGISEQHYFSMGGQRVAQRGWNLLCFDGPGQWGAKFADPGLVWRPDYETVLGAVLDYAEAEIPEVDSQAMAVLGLSKGGYLAPRAVAGQPRVKALVANPPCIDFHAMILPPVERIIDHGGYLATWVEAAFSWVFGLPSMEEIEVALRDYRLDDRVAEIACPTLSLVSDGEGGMADQVDEFCARLTVPSTRRTFTAAEGADCHCQYNNWTLSQQVTFDWLESVIPE